MSERPTIRPGLAGVIRDALALDYVSESCQDAIQTGNHYQSVTLGDEGTSGFRTRRDEFLDRIPFDGARVLDLGSNLGEISRESRRRGAKLVDGFEYDPFFVEVANAINALNGTTRVSFFCRDITDPAVYEEAYDIVLALSVFIYIEPVIEHVARITGRLLVLETHRLEGTLESMYISPVSRFFPHHVILGESEWGQTVDDRVKRAIVVFAREPDYLDDLREISGVVRSA